MKIENSGLSLIKQFEGLVLEGYLDPVGLLTIGYGHLVKKGEPFKLGHKITEREALELLRRDVAWAENCVNQFVKVPLTQNQFDALVSFVFNVGQTTFLKSSVLANVNAKRFSAAVESLKKYKFSKGKILKGLINRRNAESTLFLS